MKRVRDYAVGMLLVTAGASSASAAVIGATVADVSSGNYTLTSVSVTRGGAGTFTYVPSQLIGMDLTDVDAFSEVLLVPRGESLPAQGLRATMIEDGRLDTGVVNITTTNGSEDRSLQATFTQPVINSTGDDIILFDLNGQDSIRWWTTDRASGANVLTASFAGPLLTGMPYTTYSYVPNSSNVLGLEDLESPEEDWGPASDGTGSVFAVGLDLSTLGVPLGGSVSSIRLQSLANQGGRIDPLLIAGLPVVPEPAGMALLAVAAGGMMHRRRRA